MDFHLRCNNLRCREKLVEQAVVTTCSHIFCLDCSETSSLAPPEGHPRVCPACQERLDDPDAAVMTNLNPTSDYKTSVLSGLTPVVIMECASKGVAFYEYQCTQEIRFQEHKSRSMTVKKNEAEAALDNLKAQSASSIATLQNKLDDSVTKIHEMESGMGDLHKALRKAEAERDAIKKSWHRLKQAELDGNLAQAAEEETSYFVNNDEQYLQESGNTRATGKFLHSRAGSNGSAGRKQVRELYGLSHEGRNSLQSSRSVPVPMTPSGHRQRLAPQPGYLNRTSHLGQDYAGTMMDQLQHGTPYRQPLGPIDANSRAGLTTSNGYGLSAGMKMGRQPSGHYSRPPGMNDGRPRAGVGSMRR